MKGKNTPITKHGLIVLLLWFAAPLAWYLMWKDKRYHSWFPHLLWINGTVFAFLTIIHTYNLSVNPLFPPWLLVVILFFALTQVLAGLYFQSRKDKYQYLIQKSIIPIIIAFCVDIILGYIYVIL